MAAAYPGFWCLPPFWPNFGAPPPYLGPTGGAGATGALPTRQGLPSSFGSTLPPLWAPFPGALPCFLGQLPRADEAKGNLRAVDMAQLAQESVAAAPGPGDGAPFQHTQGFPWGIPHAYPGMPWLSAPSGGSSGPDAMQPYSSHAMEQGACRTCNVVAGLTDRLVLSWTIAFNSWVAGFVNRPLCSAAALGCRLERPPYL